MIDLPPQQTPERHAEKEPNSLRCGACGSHRTKVLWARWRQRDGAIVRRHECRDCTKRFSSHQHAA